MLITQLKSIYHGIFYFFFDIFITKGNRVKFKTVS